MKLSDMPIWVIILYVFAFWILMMIMFTVLVFLFVMLTGNETLSFLIAQAICVLIVLVGLILFIAWEDSAGVTLMTITLGFELHALWEFYKRWRGPKNRKPARSLSRVVNLGHRLGISPA